MRNHYHRRKSRLPLIIFIIMIAGVFYFYQRYQYLISTPVNSENTETVYFNIVKGEGAGLVSKKLQEKNLIPDAQSFSIYTRISGADKNIKPGRYALGQNLTPIEIAQILTTNDKRQIILTVPEGYTVTEIDDLLVANSLAAAGEFEKTVRNFSNYQKYSFLNQPNQSDLIYPLEGYLFPDTYFVDPNNFSPEILVDLMLKNFAKKIQTIAEANSTSKNFTDTIIIASMIEKEANRNQDRPLISGIIWKRLENNWVLGIDATLLYLKETREIDYQTLQEDSDYNTRRKAGLPPGPICNPGLKSIEAAFNPEESKYWYYLTSKDGDMIYSVTNEEHNYNKSKYL